MLATNTQPHDWTLTGPWYRQQSLGNSTLPSPKRPIIQKYATSDFASELLADPQHSLRFVGEDFVNDPGITPNQIVSPETPGITNNSLKLFLGTHNRFYVVICELHCETAGFPSTTRNQVAEAGFVVRRFATELSDQQRQLLQPVLKQRARLLAKISRTSRNLKRLYSKPSGGPGQLALRNSLNRKQSQKLAELNAELARNSEQLQKFKQDNNISVNAQGWQPGLHRDSGSWLTLEDEVPQQLIEQSFPLYPLIPDPKLQQHAARGHSMWFGLIPTQSADIDEPGNPKFDDNHAYEIRCFVRRQPDCDDNDDCCEGELVWSDATEPYRLAAFYDLDGCGHKPINIKMPDLNNLRQQAARSPAGKGANVRVTTPEGSSLITAPGEDFAFPDGGEPGNGAICFFAIPLITIVAMFLLKLVLPIVTFLFNLWFLLSLRLCIPPSINLDVDIAADLKLIPPEFDFKAHFDANLTLKLGTGTDSSVDSLDALADRLTPAIRSDSSMNTKMQDEMIKAIRENNDVFGIIKSLADAGTNFGDETVLDDNGNPYNPQPIKGNLAAANDGLHFFDTLEQPNA